MNKRLTILDASSTPTTCSVSMNTESKAAGDVTLKEFQGRVALVTLGCAKNQVDSEVMLGVLQNHGYEIVDDVAEADLAIVNTCGFLEAAVKESIDAIIDVAEYKEHGRLRTLVVAGCMVNRYREELEKELPEVDRFITTDELLAAGAVENSAFSEILNATARPYFLYDDTMPRIVSTQRHMAYVKIAEGCNRPCTFCIIPKIRGEMRSRPLESVVREVEELAAQGVREVNLIAQDLTSYGTDKKGPRLSALLNALADTSIDWIRLLYAYPIGIDQELLETIASTDTVCSYLDLPLQHASESLLTQMKRPRGRYGTRKIVEFISSQQPTIHLRTTFIVGFPGETEQDLAELESLVAEGHFGSVGVFTYSPEKGTPAAELPGQLEQHVKDERRARIMEAQKKVVASRLRQLKGQSFRVLIEGLHDETDLLLAGRTEFQAPEVDGLVIINDIADGVAEPQAGEFASVEITDVAGYDLVGTLVSVERA